tara:strand:- start:660 stop:905 length:246 start_codon:yes stop_codon:yes gene_type:complete
MRKVSLACVLSVVCGVAQEQEKPKITAAAKPNFVLILIDNLGQLLEGQGMLAKEGRIVDASYAPNGHGPAANDRTRSSQAT